MNSRKPTHLPVHGGIIFILAPTHNISHMDLPQSPVSMPHSPLSHINSDIDFIISHALRNRTILSTCENSNIN